MQIARTFGVLAVAAAAMAVLLALTPQAGHDQLWLLLAAMRMGPHANPYGPRVLESNPPLAIWLSALPVGLARLLRLPATAVFKSCVLLALAGSAAFCLWLLRALQRLSPSQFPGRTAANGAVFAFVWITVLAVVPARDFGQRDHLLVLLVLPYLVAAARSLLALETPMPPWPARLRFAVTLLAGLGIALKPHQALIAVAVEALLLLRTRQVRRLEPLLLVLAGAAYLLAIRLLAPTYLTEVLPLVRDTYWAFGQLTRSQLTGAALEAHLLAVLVSVLYLSRQATNPLPTILLTAGLAALVGYHLQGTGWYYQQLPALSLLSFALALLLVEQLNRKTDRRLPRGLPWYAAALGALAIALTTLFSNFHQTPRGLEQPQPVPDPAFFASLAPGTAVATLTTSVDDSVPPAFHYRLTLAQRYPHLWLLPAILRNESGPPPRRHLSVARVAELDALQHRMMVEDLLRWQPRLILVERCQDPEVHCQVLEDRHDDLLAWFARDPEFRRILAGYHLAASHGAYDGYVRNQP